MFSLQKQAANLINVFEKILNIVLSVQQIQLLGADVSLCGLNAAAHMFRFFTGPESNNRNAK